MKITFYIGINSFTMPYNWKEVSVCKAIDFYSVVYESCPPKLKEKYNIHINKAYDKDALLEKLFKDVEPKDYNNQLERFIDRLLIFWCQVPKIILEETTYESKYNIFELYLEKFVIDIFHYGATYEPDNIRAFKFDGVVYSCAETKRIDKIVIPMEGMSLIQFCEVSDLINMLHNTKESFSLAPFIIGLIYLEKGTEYNEDKLVSNYELIKQMPSNYLFEAMNLYNEYYLYCEGRFKNLFNNKPSKSKIKMNNSWNKFITDIYISSNYLLDLEELKLEKAIKWLEVKDRESEVLEYENKMQEESIKNTKR